MKQKVSMSSVTQTWQVGPSFSSERSSKQIDEHSEDTMVPLSRTLSLLFHGEQSDKKQNLLLKEGYYSVYVDVDGIKILPESKVDALFELNINVAGAFFISKNGSPVKFNNGFSSWARLRSGDEILFEGGKLLCTSNECENLEDTLFLNRENENETKKSRENRFPKRIKRRFILSLLLGSALMPLFFYARSYLGNLENTPYTAPSQISNLILNPIDSINESEVLPNRVFTKQEYEEIIAQYRNGEQGVACERLNHFISNPFLENIWIEKGRLFTKRRCH